MDKLNNNGSSGLALVTIVVSIIAVAALILAVVLFTQEEKYKNNDQQLIAAAVQQAKIQITNQEQQKFNTEAEQPFTSFSGPADYGDVTISYPKTWSAYVDSTNSNNDPINAYFNPNYVPSTNTPAVSYALRFEVLSSSYSSLLAQYTSVEQKDNYLITPYQVKNVPQDIGSMIKGNLINNAPVILVLIPLRTNTIVIWTENQSDFNLFLNQILPTLTFNP